MKPNVLNFVPGICLLVSSSVFAYGGGYHSVGYHGGGYYHNGGGYYHNGGGYYHNGGNYYHNGYYNHNNGWNNGSVIIDNGVFYDDDLNDDTGVVVGVPAGGYYDPSCQTIDDCSTGFCVLVNSCNPQY